MRRLKGSKINPTYDLLAEQLIYAPEIVLFHGTGCVCVCLFVCLSGGVGRGEG